MKDLKQIEKYFEGTKYKIVDGWLFRTVINAKGIESVHPVANFIAYITGEEEYDNGSVVKRFVLIEGIHSDGYSLPPIKVSANDFMACHWISDYWGIRCNIEPTTSSKDYVRHAIQLTAKNIENKKIYGHLGFIKHNGKWIYLHGNGAIGADNICVQLDRHLAKYCFSNLSFPQNDSFDILLDEKFIKHDISIPLLAVTYLSTLNEFLKKAGCEPKLVLFLLGKTGCRKSTLAALFLSHFGDFTNTDLPLSFRDTENSIIEQTFLLKDTLTVIDDFHPSTKADESTMAKTAQTIMRAFGDRVGKNRLRSDSSLLAAKPPRGNVIITGETVPDISESGTARFLTLELSKDDVNIPMLTDLQEKAKQGYLQADMAAYINWIIYSVNNNDTDFIGWLKSNFQHYRGEFQKRLNEVNTNIHSRIPEAVTWLYVGFVILLKFRQEQKCMSNEKCQQLSKECFDVLCQMACKHAEIVTLDKPAYKFVRKLNSLLISQSVYVTGLKDTKTDSGDSFIGYEDEQFYYLVTDIVHKRVKRLCEEQGETFTISARMLLKHLADENLIDVKGNNRTHSIRIGGTIKKLMWLRKDKFNEIASQN